MPTYNILVFILHSNSTSAGCTNLHNFKWHLRSFRVTHYVILNVILYAFYEWNVEKLQLETIQFVNIYKVAFKMTYCLTRNDFKCLLKLSNVHSNGLVNLALVAVFFLNVLIIWQRAYFFREHLLTNDGKTENIYSISKPYMQGVMCFKLYKTPWLYACRRFSEQATVFLRQIQTHVHKSIHNMWAFPWPKSNHQGAVSIAKRNFITGFKAENATIVATAVFELCVKRKHWFVAAATWMMSYLHVASIYDRRTKLV